MIHITSLVLLFSLHSPSEDVNIVGKGLRPFAQYLKLKTIHNL